MKSLPATTASLPVSPNFRAPGGETEATRVQPGELLYLCLAHSFPPSLLPAGVHLSSALHRHHLPAPLFLETPGAGSWLPTSPPPPPPSPPRSLRAEPCTQCPYS